MGRYLQAAAACLLLLLCLYWAWQSPWPGALALLLSLSWLWQTLQPTGKPQQPPQPVSDAAASMEHHPRHHKRLDFISHDLRSPLTSLLALIEGLRHSSDALANGDTCEQLHYYAERSLRCSDQLVQLLRIEELPQLATSELEALALLESVQDELTLKAKKNGIKLALVFDNQQDLWIKGNGEWLEIALTNLVDNAINYSDAGSSVRLQLSLCDDQVELAVEDRGCGIAAEDQPLLFHHYGRLKHSSPVAGASLGLHLVNTIVERHHGKLTVSSQQGEGSRFAFSLPAITIT